MLMANTAASVGAAVFNERGRGRLAFVPVVAAAAPLPAAAPIAVAPVLRAPSLLEVRLEPLRRRFGVAAGIGAGIVLLVALVPAITAMASTLGGGRAPAPAAASPYASEADHAAGELAAAKWQTLSTLRPPSTAEIWQLFAADQGRRWDVLRAMVGIAEQQAAADAAADVTSPTAAAARGWAPRAPAYSLATASGLEPGTVLSARITIYGCTGPGGGFCDRMSNGGPPFAGAAACSEDLPYGTRLTIAGDPTGRVYECLDRGQLPATWIDVYFDDTADGIAWQSSLGGTAGSITIVN